MLSKESAYIFSFYNFILLFLSVILPTFFQSSNAHMVCLCDTNSNANEAYTYKP